MKYLIVFLAAGAMLFASCAQHVCPTYANSAIKYHHHPTHPAGHH